MKQTEQEVTEGLSSDYRLEFGDTDDWIELKTGEWLRGDLHWLRPKGLESGKNVSFYSNKLDGLTLSWGSIVGVLDAQSGLGYQFLRLISTVPGVDNPQNDGFIMFRTHWKLEFLNDNVELTIDWRSNLVYTSFGQTNHTGTADVSIEITDVFSVVNSFLFL
jgi:hypothetical protein